MSHESESIVASLRSKRAMKNVSQKEAAAAIGANQSTLSRWERQDGIGFAESWVAADYFCPFDDLASRSWPPREG